MRFTIVKEEILKAVNIANKAIDKNNTAMPILTNFKLTLNEEGLFVLSSNMNISIQTQIPYKKNDQEIIRNYKEGEVVVNADLFTNITKKLESEEIVFELIDSTTAIISNSKSEYKLQCARANEYPNIDLQHNGVELKLTKTDFVNMVNQTTFAASVKEQKKILMALNLEAYNGTLTATATDSARMAKKVISIPQEIEFTANVPAKTMNEVSHMVDDVEFVNISAGTNRIMFAFANSVVAVNLLLGDYPNTKNIVPHIINYTLEVKAQELLKAIDRVKILSLERENIVDLSINSEEIVIAAKSSQIGSAIDKIQTFKFDGNDLKISFNSDYITSSIRALNCEDVTLCFVGEMKPFVIKNNLDDSVIQVVTPVRTYY